MLVLRRLRAPVALAARSNASLASSAPSEPAPPPPPPQTASASAPAPSLADPKPKKSASPPPAETPSETEAATAGRRKYPTRRPYINLAHPREWTRPIAPGVLPAYDEALRYIYADSDALVEEARQLRDQIAQTEAALAGESSAELDALKEKADIVEVQSQINRPEVRWKFRNGMGDMSIPVYRKLADQKWRKEGDLDLLMERIHQMNVVPDVLPALHPTVDLRITFPEAPTTRNSARRKAHRAVAPGTFLVSEQTRKAPNLYVSVMHPEERYYTLLMVDPDVPDEDTASYQTYLHWMITNIRLSSASTSIATSLPYIPFPYVPPHPQRGTPYHRYTLLLLPHADPAQRIDVPVTSAGAPRAPFDVRAFMEVHGLDGATGGGAHMWRGVWDEGVSKIYRDVLKREEPRYGYPPRADPYAEVKRMPKYAVL